MSKYTTQVRDICNEILLRDEPITMPKQNMSVDEILRKTWDKIFDLFAFWRPEVRGIFCMDILRHYYTREIGFETVGLWKLKLNTKMKEIMPSIPFANGMSYEFFLFHCDNRCCK